MSRRTVLSALVVAPILMIVAACGTTTDEPGSSSADATDVTSDAATETPSPTPTSAATGSPKAPAVLDFSADTVAGDTFKGASLAGRPAVLWFWAPWCPTCRAQIEGVSALADEYGDDISFVGVGSLDEAPAIEDFATDVPAEIPHLLDPDGAVWRHFGVVEQSTYVVLDADSSVVSEGYLDDDALADLVSGLAG